MAWHKPFDEYTTQRPVQWTSGVLNEETCEYEEQKIWTTTGKNGIPGKCSGGGVWVHRLDGVSGDVEDTVHIPPQTIQCNVNGPYGGATDADGNYWFHSYYDNRLIRVDYESLDYESWALDSGGIAGGLRNHARQRRPRVALGLSRTASTGCSTTTTS